MLLASNLSFYPREGFHQSRCAQLYLPRPRLASGEIGPNAVIGHGGGRIPAQPAQQVRSEKDLRCHAPGFDQVVHPLASGGEAFGCRRILVRPRTCRRWTVNARRSGRPLILGQGASPF